MGDPAGDVKTRIGDLEGQLKILRGQLATEVRERKQADAEFQKELQQVADLLMDSSATAAYVIQWLNRMQGQCHDKALKLTEAIQNFNEFLSLPAKSNKFLAYWDAAFTIITIALPALRLMKDFQKIEQNAKESMEIAKAFEASATLRSRIIAAAPKVHEVADVIRRGNDVKNKVATALQSTQSMPAHYGRSPVQAMIEEAQKARNAFDAGVTALDQEFSNRLKSIVYKAPYTAKGTLVDMAKKLLPPLQSFSADELEQLQRFYLWSILGKYAHDKVEIVTTHMRSGDSWSIEGLNDTQMEQIMEWFGPTSNWQGGKVPVIISIGIAFSFWQVGQREEYSYGAIGGYG